MTSGELNRLECLLRLGATIDEEDFDNPPMSKLFIDGCEIGFGYPAHPARMFAIGDMVIVTVFGIEVRGEKFGSNLWSNRPLPVTATYIGCRTFREVVLHALSQLVPR